MTPFCTIILPYYNQPQILTRQLANWSLYDSTTRDLFRLMIVDDGSQEQPAAHHIQTGVWRYQEGVSLYRIREDIPWNRSEARNIGAKEARTPWILQTDIDHMLTPDNAQWLAAGRHQLDRNRWYRFRRFRRGAADHTRNKDAIPRDHVYGEIKPHIDSYLCTPEAYWDAGGYNEDFSGCLGGGSPFLQFMKEAHGEPEIFAAVSLEVHTSHSVEDANADLDRDTTEYSRRRAELTKAGKLKGHDPFRIPYERVL